MYFLEILQHRNMDLSNLFSPVNASELEKLLINSNYDTNETKFLVDGFTNDFDLGYRGPSQIKQNLKNLKFFIGDKVELWNKVMKEVKEKRYAGPFKEIPFDNYIQSPIGLVPKDQGKKTRLIFHLSHPRNKDKGFSVNGCTPEDLTKVKYCDFDDAIKLCLAEGKNCAIGKSDMSSVFRHFAISKKFWKYLVMTAQNPADGQWYYFVDKCMPFGASISCSHFQRFSNAIAHLVKYFTKKDNINYLDDFFFAALMLAKCNMQIETFLKVCSSINFPVSMEKTFWGTTKLTFLGLLIDTANQLICIPIDKISKAINMIDEALWKGNKKIRKIKLHKLQQITGFLNFLCKAVIPGRAFTRRLYSIEERAVNNNLQKHHHINLTEEMRSDLEMWLEFLHHPSAFARGFLDVNKQLNSKDVNFYTDATANPQLGCGGISNNDWFILQWDEEFMEKHKPSINYLELYALTIAISNWIHKYANKYINIFCDNMSVVQMVNKSSSKCKNCMVLIRIITLMSLKHNVHISVKHVEGKLNIFADQLSRLEYKKFRKEARKRNIKFNNNPHTIPDSIWPMDKIWINNTNQQKRNKKNSN